VDGGVCPLGTPPPPPPPQGVECSIHSYNGWWVFLFFSYIESSNISHVQADEGYHIPRYYRALPAAASMSLCALHARMSLCALDDDAFYLFLQKH
jgi:hypothetical protein